MEPKPEQHPFERDLHELSRTIESKQYPEQGREAVHRAVGEQLYPEKSTTTSSQSPARKPSVTDPLPSYATDLPEEAKNKAESLLSLALSKGLMKAVAQAKKTDPLTMDLFHDAITDTLYGELQKRGLLK
jgi:hypothetical protein